MAGADPLRQLRKIGVIEPQARYFAKNRGLALLVRKGNPLGIHGLHRCGTHGCADRAAGCD